MAPFILFIRKLHQHAGARLYLNLCGLILIGFFEGIGIYLIVPLLGVIGVIQAADVSSMPLISGLARINLDSDWALPAILLLYVGILVGVGLLQRNNTVLNTKIQQGFIYSLRMETYQSLLQAEWAFFLKRKKSDFQHVLTSELARVSQGTMLFMQLIASLIFTLIQVILALWLSPLLTLIVLICGLAIGGFARRFVRSAKRLGDRTTALSQDYYFGLNDQLSGMKEIKSNMLETTYLHWFRRLNQQIMNNNVAFVVLRTRTQFMYKAAAALLVAGFVYLAVAWISVSPEYLLVLVLIFSRIWPQFSSMQSNLEQMIAMLPAFEQLMELQRDSRAAAETAAGGGESSSGPLRIKERIECRNVTFRYGGDAEEAVLRKINLIIPARAMTAIVGKSGAGKSTLVDILMGLIQPEQGELLVDGELVSKETLRALRRSISYVAQDPFLFHLSIRENLTLGLRDVREEEIWEALRLSAAEEFVKRLPQGLDTIVGDRGIRLSGGEKQRIVLARAILRKPDILVLDEATSALDVEHEAEIQEALLNLKQRMTLIVIAHRLSTIRHADQVIVLERGEIVQRGAFAELAGDAEGLFGHMWRKQGEGIG